MRSARRLIALLVVLALTATTLAGDDVLKTYKKRFGGDAYYSEREAVLEELAVSGAIKALKALLWCNDLTRERIAKAEKVADEYLKRAHARSNERMSVINRAESEYPRWGSGEMEVTRAELLNGEVGHLQHYILVPLADRGMDLEGQAHVFADLHRVDRRLPRALHLAPLIVDRRGDVVEADADPGSSSVHELLRDLAIK